MILTPRVEGEPALRVTWQLTYFLNGVFFILEEYAVCEVHGRLESALLAGELEKLGGAELVPPLVGSRAEAQTQSKEETLQGAAEGRAVHGSLGTHLHSPPPFTLTMGALPRRDWGSHLTHRDTEAQRWQDLFKCIQSWNLDIYNFQTERIRPT